MASTFHVDIVSAEQAVFSGVVEMLVAPAINGELGIMPRHNQLIAQLKPGEIRLTLPNQTEIQSIYVSGGVLEVQPHVVTVLSDTAVRAHDLDEAAASEAKRHAEDALNNNNADIDYAKARAELAEAVAQLDLIKKFRGK
ncbi:MAG: F0F1 ATP synthase subunit epsilon [Gammaproteobacteria bacterium]|nr:F0F1 ATP synthase subunit epsilon [Gammaproteobacteria bacterium]